MTRRVLRKFFWNTYDHLGMGVVLNVVWFVLAIPWILVTYFLFFVLVPWLGVFGLATSIVAAAGAFWLNPATLAFLGAASEWANYHTPGMSELWALLRSRFLTGLWLSGVALGVAVVLGVNTAFYFRLPGALRWVGYLLAGIMLWGQLFFLTIVFHLGLLLARDEHLSPPQGLRQAVFLTLKVPLLSFLLGVTTLGMAAGLAITAVGIPFVAALIPATFATTGERELLKRFRPPEPGQREANEGEEVRGLRDLLRPWDMGR